MESKATDILIIGAGAAGLNAAHELTRQGRKVIVLEARDRAGGRIFTKHDLSSGIPIELGAEFIHGAPKETLDLLAAGNLPFYDVLDSHFTPGPDGKLGKLEGYWERLGGIMEKLDPEREKDRSFREFVDAHKDSIDSQTQALALQFAEGFHGADANLLSEKGLSSAEQATDNINGTEAFRLVHGYESLVRALLQRIPEIDQVLRLQRAVTDIQWKPNDVTVIARHRVTGAKETYTARCVLVTVPLGVLLSQEKEEGHIRFSPEIPALRESLSGLRMGSAIRLVLRFRTRNAWENLGTDPIGYLHAGKNQGDATFPVWWTPMPVRAPTLTAWTGGPKALALANNTPSELACLALKTLSQILGCELSFLEDELEGFDYHDWQNDPYSRGAYSYIVKDGIEGAKRFGLPFEGTLYFAGEATHMGSERGTVDGALVTGSRAAKQILEQTNRK